MYTIRKKGNIFFLTLNNDEHCLNPTLLNSIKSTLHRVRQQATTSSVLITIAHDKFFSNGYDIDWAQSNKSRFILIDDSLRSVLSELISLPMPTIAVVTGHASTAGYIFALSHDYFLMSSDHEFLYKNELDIDIDIDHVIPAWFVAVVEAKVGDALAMKRIVTEAEKVTAEEAVRLGIVDSAHDSVEETVKAAVELSGDLVKRGLNGDVYAENRKKLLGHVIGTVEDNPLTKQPLMLVLLMLQLAQMVASCFSTM